MIFLLKKIVGAFLKPLPITLFLLFAALVLFWRGKRIKLGKILATGAFAILVLTSFFPIPDLILEPLEREYPPLSENVFNSENPPQYVLVLGGGHTHDSRFPLTAQIGRESLARLIEGIRIQRKIKGAKLLLSGGAVFSGKSNAEMMADVAESIGVKREDMILEIESRDTRDEARIVSQMIGKKPFIMVTSAGHMPRSMALFKKMAMNPIPAPTGHLVMEEPGYIDWRTFLPKTENVDKFNDAIHEYLGMAWAKLRGQI